MTDKEKIREEVQRLMNELIQEKERGYDSDIDDACILELQNVLTYIDSIPKESVSSIWHNASEEPKIDKTFLLVAPNGNSSLCLWGGKYLHSTTLGGGHSVLCKDDKWAYIDDLLHKQEEPVSEQNLSNVQRTVKNWKDFVSEDLGEYINELSKQFPEVSFAKLSRIAVRVAQWQKEQMMSKAIDALVHTFDNGYIRVGTQLLENNKYGLKVGDKVKVIIIKDE